MSMNIDEVFIGPSIGIGFLEYISIAEFCKLSRGSSPSEPGAFAQVKDNTEKNTTIHEKRFLSLASVHFR